MADDDDHDLFSHADAFARNDDPSTSHLAAFHVDAASLEHQVYLYLLAQGDANTRKISEDLKIKEGSITPRMKPLETKGLVARVGKTIEAPRQIIWRALRTAKPHEDLAGEFH
jgi:DNA-binding MarR family transcriptional regulator